MSGSNSNQLSERLEEAVALAEVSPEKSVKELEVFAAENVSSGNEQGIRDKEAAIYKLGEVYSKLGKDQELSTLIKHTRGAFLSCLSKAKSAQLVRKLVDHYLAMKGCSLKNAVVLCKECISWADSDKRSFLRQALETRLISVYIDMGDYPSALQLTAKLVKELKKLDDKALLVEVQLLESRAYYLLKNIPKSRAALTSARTSANAIYCPPALQANLDLMAGILHAEENDFKTSFSYFYEAFEQFDSIENMKMAMSSLKYMILSKIMLGLSDDVYSIMSGKLVLKYAGRDLDAMRGIAKAHSDRSLAELEKCVKGFTSELNEDPIIKCHLNALKDTLLEENLCRIIEPFSRVEIAHVASLINLPVPIVETKLSQMILDKKFSGILDQGAGCLIIFEACPVDMTYAASIQTIQNMGNVVDSLYAKARTLA
eukprot:Nk52_evm10s2367 gene=Nk52_evmTU10s2367